MCTLVPTMQMSQSQSNLLWLICMGSTRELEHNLHHEDEMRFLISKAYMLHKMDQSNPTVLILLMQDLWLVVGSLRFWKHHPFRSQNLHQCLYSKCPLVWLNVSTAARLFIFIVYPIPVKKASELSNVFHDTFLLIIYHHISSLLQFLQPHLLYIVFATTFSCKLSFSCQLFSTCE